MKIGRIKFKVKDFRTDDSQATEENSPVKFKADQFEYPDSCEEAVEIDCQALSPEQSEYSCRFCWNAEQPDGNPLLSSCRCDGSVRFIHYECLKNWIRVKMQKKEDDHIISYIWKQFECEICKKAYPYTFKSNGRKYKLVDIEVPEEGNFMLL